MSSGTTADRGVTRSFVRLAIGSVGAQVLNIPLFLLLARALGPEQFGVQSTAVAIALLSTLLLDAGGSVWYQRHVAMHGIDDDARGWLLRRFGLTTWIALLSVPVLVLGQPLVAAAVLSTAVGVSTSALSSVLRGIGRYGAASVALLLDRAAALGFAIPFLLGVESIGSVVLPGSYAVGGLAQLALMLVAAELPKPWPVLAMRLADFRVGRKFLGLELLNESQRLDVPIVTLAGGSTAAGFFASTARVTGPLGMPVYVLCQVLLQRLVQASGATRRRLVARSAVLLVLLYSVVAGCVALTAETLIAVTIGDAYAAAAPILRLLTVALVPASLNQLLSTVLTADHREGVTLRRVAVTAPLSLVLVYAGTLHSGAPGAAIGFLVAQVVLLVLLMRPAVAGLKDVAPGTPDDVPG